MKDAEVSGRRVNHLYGPSDSTVAPPKLGLPHQRPQQTVHHLYPSTGANLVPRGDELANLRRQQAAFHDVRAGLDLQNRWMAIAALAPVVVPLGSAVGTAAAGRLTGPALSRTPLNLLGREPYLRVGDNGATRIGRRAHKALEERAKLKDGWESNLERPTSKGIRRPDVSAPARNPEKPGVRYQMELKPDTPSGRRAAARAVKEYQQLTGNKTRPLFYDPKNFQNVQMTSTTYIAAVDRVLTPLGFIRDPTMKGRDKIWTRIRNDREESVLVGADPNWGTSATLFSRDLSLEALMREAMPSPSPVHFSVFGQGLGTLIDGFQRHWRRDKNGPIELAKAIADHAPAYFDSRPAIEARNLQAQKEHSKEWSRAPDVVRLALGLYRAGERDEACKVLNRKLSKFSRQEWLDDVEAVRRWLGCEAPKS